MISPFLRYHFRKVVICFFAVMPLLSLAVILVILLTQNQEFILPCKIRVAIYVITANTSIQSYISKFSHVKCSILSFYCTVLFTGCSVKKTLKSLLHRARLRINREASQISVFACMFLSLVKKNAFHFLFTVLYCPMCRALYKRRFEQHTAQGMSKEKSRNIVNSSSWSYVTKFSQKCFILSVIALPYVQSVLNHLLH